MAVDRGVADAGPAGDLVQRHLGAELDEHLPRGGDDPLPVAQGVGPRTRGTARLRGDGCGLHDFAPCCADS